MAEYPETMKDELEAYPLRLNVAALPDRRFFKMIRTLTVGVVLLSAFLIVLGVYLNYQLTHLDVTVRRRGSWQFYRIDPEDKKLKPLESSTIYVDPMRLIVEDKLREYIKLRNTAVLAEDTMSKVQDPLGLVVQMSSPEVLLEFTPEFEAMKRRTVNAPDEVLVRDVHIYSLTILPSNLWVALIETFDLPTTDDGIGVCGCSDNSKACLNCKIQNAKRRERRKIWMRVSNRKPKECRADNRNTDSDQRCFNPLGLSVDKYISTMVPIHPEETYWDLPPALRPEI